MTEYVKVFNLLHIYLGEDCTMCGMSINWYEGEVTGVCHANEIPDLACIDCAVLEDILNVGDSKR